jgi:hypothetical protein
MHLLCQTRVPPTRPRQRPTTPAIIAPILKLGLGAQPPGKQVGCVQGARSNGQQLLMDAGIIHMLACITDRDKQWPPGVEDTAGPWIASDRPLLSSLTLAESGKTLPRSTSGRACIFDTTRLVLFDAPAKSILLPIGRPYASRKFEKTLGAICQGALLYNAPAWPYQGFAFTMRAAATKAACSPFHSQLRFRSDILTCHNTNFDIYQS